MRRSLAAVVAVLLALPAFAQPSTDATADSLVGPVKRLVAVFTPRTGTDRTPTRLVTTYRPDGGLLEATTSGPKGADRRERYLYDGAGRKTERQVYGPDGKLDSTEVYRYAGGRLVASTTRYRSGRADEEAAYRYDGAGRLTRIATASSETVFVYSPQGGLASQSFTSKPSGGLYGSTLTTRYGADGRPEGYTAESTAPGLRRLSFVFVYGPNDARGNWTRRETFQVSEAGRRTLDQTLERTIIYY